MSDNLPTVDITTLVKYLDKVNDIASINKMMGATYLRDFIIGQDIAGQLLARAVQTDIRAKSRLEEAEAIAYLDRSTEYLKNKGIKETSEARKMYVCLDEDVKKAQDDKAKSEALVMLLKNKLSVLRQSHDSLKKILYDNNSGTSWEGMS